jgi:photosystem II stability/assembly factor-like uncharacterized protein
MVSLFAAYEDSVLVVSDALDDPTATRVLTGTRPECVAVDAAAPDRVFVGTFESGLQRSLDGGETWTRAADIAEEAVMSLAVHPDDPDTIYAGTEPSTVYRTTDGGDSWTELPGLTDLPSEPQWSFPPRPHTHHVRWLEVDPNDPDHLYVGIEAGALVQSHDAGETWVDRVEGTRRDTHSIETHPDAPGHAWVAAGDGFAMTTDGGETWDHPQSGLDHRYCWSVVVDPGNPETVLVSSASGAYAAHSLPAESYLYRSRGEGWERLDNRGVPTGEGVIRAVLVPGSEAGECFLANNPGLYRTTDAGDAWTELDVSLPQGFGSQTCRGLAVLPE